MSTRQSSRDLAWWRCEGNIGEAVEQVETLCDEVETVRVFRYFGDRVSAGGRCEVAFAA